VPITDADCGALSPAPWVIALQFCSRLGDDGADAFRIGGLALGGGALQQLDQKAEAGLAHAEGAVDAGRRIVLLEETQESLPHVSRVGGDGIGEFAQLFAERLGSPLRQLEQRAFVGCDEPHSHPVEKEAPL